jgi:hypothetical protein
MAMVASKGGTATLPYGPGAPCPCHSSRSSRCPAESAYPCRRELRMLSAIASQDHRPPPRTSRPRIRPDGRKVNKSYTVNHKAECCVAQDHTRPSTARPPTYRDEFKRRPEAMPQQVASLTAIQGPRAAAGGEFNAVQRRQHIQNRKYPHDEVQELPQDHVAEFYAVPRRGRCRSTRC